jgi:hypothetical protein
MSEGRWPARRPFRGGGERSRSSQCLPSNRTAVTEKRVGDVDDESRLQRSKQRAGVAPSVLAAASDKVSNVGQEATATEESHGHEREAATEKSAKLWRARKTNLILKFCSI